MSFLSRESRSSSSARLSADRWRLIRVMDDASAWSLPIGRILGVRIRFHALLLMLIAAELLRSTIFADRETVSGPSITATALFALVIVCFAHEIGKALMTRWMGGSAETIVLWPLGGLSEHQQPAAWRRRLLAACGGLLVSFVLASAIWPVLIEHTPNWYSTITQPLHPGASYGEWLLVSGKPAWWLSLLWWIGYANLVVFAANLLPVYPLDGAAALESVLAAVLGVRRSRAASLAVALGFSVLIVFASLLMQQVMGVFLGGFALLCCMTAARRQAFLEEPAAPRRQESPLPPPDLIPADFDEVVSHAPRSVANLETTAFPVRLEAAPDTKQRLAPARAKSSDELPTEEEVVDRLLAKISAQGMASLTEQERKILESVTARRRRG